MITPQQVVKSKQKLQAHDGALHVKVSKPTCTKDVSNKQDLKKNDKTERGHTPLLPYKFSTAFTDASLNSETMSGIIANHVDLPTLGYEACQSILVHFVCDG